MGICLNVHIAIMTRVLCLLLNSKWTPNPLHKGIDFTAEQNFLTKFPCFQLNFMCCLNRKISLIASKYFFELLFVYDIILK